MASLIWQFSVETNSWGFFSNSEANCIDFTVQNPLGIIQLVPFIA